MSHVLYLSETVNGTNLIRIANKRRGIFNQRITI